MRDIRDIQPRSGPSGGQASLAQRLTGPILDRFPALRAFAGQVGGTPLVEVPGDPDGARILAKCEWTNPTGSVKDRTAVGLMSAMLDKLDPPSLRGQRVLEYSGGNLGFALARLCRDLDLDLTLVQSAGTPADQVESLRGQGAEVILVPSERGFLGVMLEAMYLARDHPEWPFLYQHTNAANVVVHRRSTGAEIVEQLGARGGTVDGWVTSIGTGGTLIGVWQALLACNPFVTVCATTPAELPYGSMAPPNGDPKFAGSGGLGLGWRQPLVAPFDANVSQHFTYGMDEALDAMATFHDLTGVWIGSSAAANWLAARSMAGRMGPGRTVVTLFAGLATDAERVKAEARRQARSACWDARGGLVELDRR